MPPQELRIGREWGQAGQGRILAGYCVVDAEGGALRIFLAQTGPKILEFGRYRLVVLDAAGKRYLPKQHSQGGSKIPEAELSTTLFTLDPKTLPPSKAAYV